VCDGQSPQKIKDLGALQIVCWIFVTNVGAWLGHDLSQFVTSNIGSRIGDELVQIALIGSDGRRGIGFKSGRKSIRASNRCRTLRNPAALFVEAAPKSRSRNPDLLNRMQQVHPEMEMGITDIVSNADPALPGDNITKPLISALLPLLGSRYEGASRAKNV